MPIGSVWIASAGSPMLTDRKMRKGKGGARGFHSIESLRALMYTMKGKNKVIAVVNFVIEAMSQPWV